MPSQSIVNGSRAEPAAQGPGFHHVGVQAVDLDQSVNWYLDFFGGRLNWSLDRFSELTLSRLPGITRLVEIEAAGLRFHLFERPGRPMSRRDADASQFQHVCISAGSLAEVENWRARWVELYETGKYAFTSPEPPSRIDTDGTGISSFYFFDPNGLEFEFTHIPAGAS